MVLAAVCRGAPHPTSARAMLGERAVKPPVILRDVGTSGPRPPPATGCIFHLFPFGAAAKVPPRPIAQVFPMRSHLIRAAIAASLIVFVAGCNKPPGESGTAAVPAGAT